MKGIGFVVGLLLIDFLLGNSLRYMFFHSKHNDPEGVLPPRANEMDADLIIFGSSRAKYHYDADLIGHAIGMKAYNAGADGRGIFYSVLLERFLFAKNVKPRFFVVDVWDTDFCSEFVEPTGWEKFILYANEVKGMRDLLIQINPGLRLKLLSSSYPFNSHFMMVLRDFVRSKIQRSNLNLREFVGLDSDYVGETGSHQFKEDCRPIHTQMRMHAINLYEEFIRTAKEAGISVILTYSPQLLYPRPLEKREEFSQLLGMAKQWNVPVIAVSAREHPEFTNKDYFRDAFHVNRRGAELFSKIIAEQLKPIILQSAKR